MRIKDAHMYVPRSETRQEDTTVLMLICRDEYSCRVASQALSGSPGKQPIAGEPLVHLHTASRMTSDCKRNFFTI